MYYKALGKRYGFTLDTPIQEMSKEAVHAILYGTGTEKSRCSARICLAPAPI